MQVRDDGTHLHGGIPPRIAHDDSIGLDQIERDSSCLERNQEDSALGVIRESLDGVVTRSRGHGTLNANELPVADLETTSDEVTASERVSFELRAEHLNINSQHGGELREDERLESVILALGLAELLHPVSSQSQRVARGPHRRKTHRASILVDVLTLEGSSRPRIP